MEDGLDFQPRPSVWAEVEAGLRPAEVPEARRCMGEALIQGNDDLFAEAASLLDILREYSAEVDHRVREGAWRARLLKRDAKREMLEGEIREFVAALRSKTSTPLSLRPGTAREKAVISYVSGEPSDEPSRPGTARELLASRSRGRDTSHRPGTADLVDRLCAGQGQVHDRLGAVSGPLKEALRGEKAVLLEDVAFLQRCLELEHDRDLEASSCAPPPSIPTDVELLDLRHRLKVELQLAEAEQKGRQGGGRLAPIGGVQEGHKVVGLAPGAGGLLLGGGNAAMGGAGTGEVVGGQGRAVSRGSFQLGEDEDLFLFGSQESSSDEENEGDGEEAGVHPVRGDVLILSDSDGEGEEAVGGEDADAELMRQSQEIALLLSKLKALRGESTHAPHSLDGEAAGAGAGRTPEAARRKSSASGRHRSLIAAARAELGEEAEDPSERHEGLVACGMGGLGDVAEGRSLAAGGGGGQRRLLPGGLPSWGGGRGAGGQAETEPGQGSMTMRLRRVVGAGSIRPGKENGTHDGVPTAAGKADGVPPALGITGKAVGGREAVRQSPKPPASPARPPEGGAGPGGARVRPVYRRPGHKQAA